MNPCFPKFRLSSILWAVLVLSLCLAWGVDKFYSQEKEPVWSNPVNGIRARIELRPGKTVNGTMLFDTFLLLENVSDTSGAIELDVNFENVHLELVDSCLLYTSPSPRDGLLSRMPSSA